jgi:RluA family pseudouridine synthase
MAALLQARVLYQDDHVLVIDKPAGLAVHPGPRTAESLELYLPCLMLDRKKPPQPVHRLDRDTSGCLVLGRTPGSVRQLSSWFSERQVEKTYLAIVEGVPDASAGLIDAPLLKTSSKAGGWRMVVAAQGQSARTRWRLLKRDGCLSLMELKPETGRTHQLRVHCAEAGWPISGDPVYGTARPDKRMYLHASEIVLPTREGGHLTVIAPQPDDWPLASLEMPAGTVAGTIG